MHVPESRRFHMRMIRGANEAPAAANFNLGQDTVKIPFNHYNTITDSHTLTTVAARPTLKIEHRNAIRELRDLI